MSSPTKLGANEAAQLSRDEGISLREACEKIADKYSVKSETIRKALNRARKGSETPHKQLLLTCHEEINLTAILRARSCWGVGWNQAQILNFVRSYKGLPPEWDGWSWIRHFMVRQASWLKLRKPISTDIKRIHNVTTEDIEGFCDTVGHLLESFKGNPDFIINVDETMVMSDNVEDSKVLASSDLVEACMAKAGYDSLRTIVPFLGAGGKVWAVLLIFRAGAGEHSKPILKDLFKNFGNKSYKIFIAVTDSGWMTKTVWEDVMEQFVALIKPSLRDDGAILLLDHLPSHESGTTIGLMSQNNIRVGFFPYTSSFMQPADSYAFARLKQEIHRRVYELLQSFLISRVSPTYIFQEVIPAALRSALTKECITASFRDTGMFPWDRQKILDFSSKRLKPADKPSEAVQVPPLLKQLEEHYTKMLQDHQIPKKRAKIGVPEKNRVYLDTDIIAHQEAKEAAAELKKSEVQKNATEKKRKREEKAAEKAEKASKVSWCLGCRSEYRGGKGWWKCPTCPFAYVCKPCTKECVNDVHEEECATNGPSQ